MSNTDNTLPAGAVPLAASLPVGESAPVSKAVAFQRAGAIEIELPDGRLVGMDRPKMALSEYLAGCLGTLEFVSSQAYETERARIRSLLYITSVDGEAQPKIADPIMRMALEEKLGDENLDALLMQWAKSFPSTDPSVLKIVKKS